MATRKHMSHPNVAQSNTMQYGELKVRRDGGGETHQTTYSDAALPLFKKTGLSDALEDGGFFALKKACDCAAFIEACSALRLRDRELALPI